VSGVLGEFTNVYSLLQESVPCKESCTILCCLRRVFEPEALHLRYGQVSGQAKCPCAGDAFCRLAAALSATADSAGLVCVRGDGGGVRPGHVGPGGFSFDKVMSDLPYQAARSVYRCGPPIS